MNAIIFRNFTNEDFSWKFDGVMFDFKAGQEIYLEEPKTKHFAKHLVDREINKINVERHLLGTKNEISTGEINIRRELTDKALPVGETLTPVEALNVEEKKKRKPKKVVEEFADLKKKK